jgi:BirA family transcriptional regulator, biotin operon repressor / biotin---[acetyl-CoA-carboxylase] ligase
VTATEQSAGRGRQGRRWSAPAGDALLMSLLLRSGGAGESPSAGAAIRSSAPLPLIAAVAVCDAVAQTEVGDRAKIKWPNDIVLARPSAASAREATGPLASREAAGLPALAKLAGILIEGRPQEGWAVLGIGVNVALRVEQLPAELHATAASLELPRDQIESLRARLLAALERRLAEPAVAVLDAWRARDALRGRELSWSGGRGRAEGIDGEGRLLVALPGGGRATLDAGEVHLGPFSSKS